MASVEKLIDLGYTHDIRGDELKEDTQILELFPQDLFLAEMEENLLKINISKTSNRFYKMKPNLMQKLSMIWLVTCCLSHTSGGYYAGLLDGQMHLLDMVTLFHAARGEIVMEMKIASCYYSMDC